MKRRTADAARGKWRGILLALNIEDSFLTGKHGPCPICGGTDRFRWDNQNGNGGYICGQCGAGSGFSLLMAVQGWDFATAARRVDEVVGNVDAEPIHKEMKPLARAAMLNQLWTASRPIEAGDPACAYLTGRVQLPKSIPNCLRFAPECPSPDRLKRPALLALVQGADGEPANIHRTFLGPNGKAEMDNPRAMMPGQIPEGSAVRLFPVYGERLGIAEGIETAFAAAAKFGVPVWSAINASMLAKWQPPEGVREVLIFGDCDRKFGGQAAAFSLAHKLAGRLRLTAQVLIPPETGTDWADMPAGLMGSNGRDQSE
jgi:putative DNA primase/helicase